MASEKASSSALPPPSQPIRRISPEPSQLRHRPLGRAATLGENTLPSYRRRSSLFSDTVSETRRSLRQSTDDLLLPRVTVSSALHDHQEPSHWHSVPLGLALLPSVGGLLFHNGSAVVTDLTLLALAAIFLNWSVRLPWDWYRSAQATRHEFLTGSSQFDTIAEESSEDDDNEEAISSSQDTVPGEIANTKAEDPVRRRPAASVLAAQRELQYHEILALFACFLFPVIGAWLLHTIRSQLSRPSEGLVSNYNLSVFLLASEIRPMSHLVKLIQGRTLFLQRVVSTNAADDDTKVDSIKFIDLTRRLEELEAHIANSAESTQKKVAGASEIVAAKATAQATSEMRKNFQPELDALNRAVRRYEKRTTISALQTEARLQDIESRLKDVVVLAAAAQRVAEHRPDNFILILANWVCAMIVVPLQCIWYLVSIPARTWYWGLSYAKRLFGFGQSRKLKETRPTKSGGSARLRDRRVKIAS